MIMIHFPSKRSLHRVVRVSVKGSGKNWGKELSYLKAL